MIKSPHVAYKQIPTLSNILERFSDLKAVIFDMDGTLFDSEIFHTKALMEIGNQFQIIPPYPAHEVHQLLMGKADHLIFEIVKEWQGFPKDLGIAEFIELKNKSLKVQLSQTASHKFFPPSLLSLLKEIQQSPLKLALVTSSERVVVENMLSMTGITDLFNYTLTRDESEFVKPNPWPYSNMLQTLKLDGEEVLVFEDSNVGMRSALDAGCNVAQVLWF